MTTIVATIEGVDRTLLQRLRNQMTLPWFDAAFDKKVNFLLSSGVVPYEAPNMTSALSGVSPGNHGIYSLWESAYTADTPRVMTAADVKASRIWEWEELRDHRFGLVNLHLTHPPRQVSGFCLAYLMHQTLNFSHPRELVHQLAAKGLRYGHDVSALYTGQAANHFYAEVHRIAQYQLQTAIALTPAVDVLIINITIADRLSHFLWPDIDADDLAQSHLAQAYQFIDQALGELDRLRRPGESMLVFSEMGFGALDHFISLDDALWQCGLQSRDADGNIDESRSLARESVQGSHGVNLIPIPNGQPRPESDLRELCDALQKFRCVDNGEPMLATARPRAEVYQGAYTHLAPDVVVEPANLKRPPMGDKRWAAKVHRHLQNGWHRCGGFGFLMYDGLGHPTFGVQEYPAECIAPTIARMLNRSAPLHCTIPSLIPE